MTKGRTKLLYIIVSILVSLLLWFYVVGVGNPDTEQTIRDIPVTFKGEDVLREDKGLVVSGTVPSVTIRVSGRMVDLSALLQRKEEIVATVDLSRISAPGDMRLPYDIEIPLDDKITIVERDPAYYIDVHVERIFAVSVEIRLKNEGSVAEGFIANEPVFSPETLQVTGPEEITSRIDYAEVVWDRTNVERTMTADLAYKLYDEYGVEIPQDQLTFNSDFITVTMNVLKTRDVPLQIEVLAGGGAEPRHVTYSIEPETVSVAGPALAIDALNALTVGTLDLAKVINSGKIEYSIVLPNELISLSGETTCEVSVEITGLTTRTLECTNIELVGIPDGVELELVTNELPTLVRGNSESVNLVFAHNLRAVADLSGMSFAVGRYTVPVTVYLDGFTDVGVVGEYKVAIQVTKVR
ncbi:hypothetical protein LJC34_03925 [Oscillospiraceae bacterium OttesenSCG-928-G22]|nr:hypothetical protein [Oscillospiraceae bacterium OttesenSCG-928-G22]